MIEHIFAALAGVVLSVLFIKLTKKKDECKWIFLAGKYDTGCNGVFYDSTETFAPVTDWATYCPHCGGKIKLAKNMRDFLESKKPNKATFDISDR